MFSIINLSKYLVVVLSITAVTAIPIDDDSYYSESYPSESDSYVDVEDYEADPLEESDDAIYYQCPDGGFRIAVELLCDGHPDCTDETDESPSTCAAYGRATTDSIYSSSPPLVEPSDEFDMDYTLCEDDSSMFQCASTDGLCIPQEAVCDGLRDCPDGEDEISCGTTNSIDYADYDAEDKTANLTEETQLKMLSSTSSPSAKTLRPEDDSDSFLDEELKSSNIVSENSYTSSTTTVSSVNADSVFIPRLLVHTQPPRVRKLEKVNKNNKINAGFQQVIRYAPVKPEPRLASSYLGESGETSVKHTSDTLQALSDAEAEAFFQNYVEKLTEESTTGVATTKQQHSSTIPVTDDMIPPTTTSSTTSYSTLIQQRRKKHRQNPKKKVKGLLYQLVRQMGKLMTSKVDDFDLDVSINLREISKTKRAFSEAADTSESRNLSQQREPKINFRLEMSL